MTQQEIHVRIASDPTALLGPNPEQGGLLASYEKLGRQVSDALHREYPGVYVWVEVRGQQPGRTRLEGFPLSEHNALHEQIADIIHEVWSAFGWLTA